MNVGLPTITMNNHLESGMNSNLNNRIISRRRNETDGTEYCISPQSSLYFWSVLVCFFVIYFFSFYSHCRYLDKILFFVSFW